MSAPYTDVQARQDPRTRFEGCLPPLLAALRWRGSARQLAEATGLRNVSTLSDLRNATARLGFLSTMRRGQLADIDPRLLPCLFVGAGRVLVVLSADGAGGALRCHDAASGESVAVERMGLAGEIYRFEQKESDAGASGAAAEGWVRRLLRPFERQFAFLLATTLVLNLIALAPAFFVQAVYDHVLPTRSVETLGFLLGGVVLAILCEVALRTVRGVALAHIGARLDFLIGVGILGKLLSLPLSHLEKSGVGAKLAHLREGEAIRAVFSTQIASAVLELPFLLVFVAALATLAGWLALVPVAIGFAAAASAYLVLRYLRRVARLGTRGRGDHHALLLEMLANMPAIRASGAETIWLERYRYRSAQSAAASLSEARLAGLTDAFAHAINVVAGAATLSIGAALSLDGSLSVGALIAAMTLVWRMLAPVQALFVALARIEQVARAASRINRLMLAPSDASAESGRTQTARGRRFAGRIAFDRVYFRHDGHYEPALAGISFAAKPGEVVALTGGNGSGKSTVLKLIAALLQPQMGSIAIDGVDIRQIGAVDLRQWVSFLPQRSDLFDGSLRDNLRIANPALGDVEICDALARVGLLAEVEALPDGLDTEMNDQLPTGFVRRLVLARTLLIDAAIVLLDEPAATLDADGEDLLAEQLETLRGRATVLIATHHPEQLRLADRVIVLRSGTIVHDGTPAELINRIAGQAS